MRVRRIEATRERLLRQSPLREPVRRNVRVGRATPGVVRHVARRPGDGHPSPAEIAGENIPGVKVGDGAPATRTVERSVGHGAYCGNRGPWLLLAMPTMGPSGSGGTPAARPSSTRATLATCSCSTSAPISRRPPRASFSRGFNRLIRARRCRTLLASNPPTSAEGEWLVRWFRPWLDRGYPDPAAPGERRKSVGVRDAPKAKRPRSGVTSREAAPTGRS